MYSTRISILYPLVVYVIGITHSICDISFVNSLRKTIDNAYGIKYDCVHPSNLSMLYPSDFLHELAASKASELDDPECPFEHDTCFKNCYLYNSCYWYDRVSYHEDIGNAVYGEILSTFENEIDTFTNILNHRTHCDILVSPRFRSIGYTISSTRRYLVMVFSSKIYPKEFIHHENVSYKIFPDGCVETINA